MKYKKSKALVKKLITTEAKKEGIKITATPISSSLENLLYILKKEKKQYSKFNNESKRDFRKANFDKESYGYYDYYTNSLKVFLSHIRKNKEISPNKDFYLLNLLINTYHEFHHCMDYNQLSEVDELTLKAFVFLFEDECYDLYKKNAIEFYSEISANIYAYKKTTEILKKHPIIYKKVIEYFYLLDLWQKIYYINYDIESLLNKKNPINSILPNNKVINRDLILDEYWTTQELETKYTIISSKFYLDNLEYNDLTKEELQILLKALIYSLKKEELKKKNNIKIEQKINKCREKISSKYENEINIIESVLYQKQKRNQGKIRYLEIQINDINKILKSEKNNINKYLVKKKSPTIINSSLKNYS